MTPTCVKCGGYSFQNVQQAPTGSRFKVSFVCCSSCGGIAGTLDYYAVGTVLRSVGRAVLAIASHVGASLGREDRTMLEGD